MYTQQQKVKLIEKIVPQLPYLLNSEFHWLTSTASKLTNVDVNYIFSHTTGPARYLEIAIRLSPWNPVDCSQQN